MATFGYKDIQRVGRGIQVSADGNPLAKAGGVTVEWATITAASADYEVRPEGEVGTANFLSVNAPADDYVYAGEKFIRYGTVLCKIVGGTSDGKYAPYGSTSGLGGGVLSTARGDMFICNESMHDTDYASDHPHVIYGGLLFKDRIQVNYATVQTITMSATGGTFTVSYKGVATSAQAYNVSASTLQTALEGLSTIGTGKVTVSLNSGVYTITLSDDLGVHQAFVLGVGSLTGGTATLGTAANTVHGPTVSEFNTAFPQASLVTD